MKKRQLITRQITMTHDSQANAYYFLLRKNTKATKTRLIETCNLLVDYDPYGRIVGFEIVPFPESAD